MKPYTVAERTLMSKESVLEVLAPYFAVLMAIWRQAHDYAMRAVAVDPAAIPRISSRTLANLRYDRASSLLSAAIQGDPTVKEVLSGKLIRFIFANKVSLRLKKLDDKMTSSNIPTRQQRLIRKQMTIFEDSLTQVEAGYRLDPTGLELVGFYITCPRDFGANYWDFRIDDDAAKSTPLFTSTATAPVREIVIRRRQAKTMEKAE